MIVDDLLLWFKANRSSNKKDFSNNVHRAYEAYRYIDQDYTKLDISEFMKNIDTFYKKALVPNYKPTSVRNYLRDFITSLDLPIIEKNVPSDILENAKEKCKSYMKAADKVANDTIKGSEDDVESFNLDINDIVAKPPQLDSDDLMRKENEMLKDEIKWLRKLVELMVLNK